MLEPQRPRVQLPENCSTRSELWFQLLQLCSGTNNVQLEVSCSNSLHWLLNHLLHISSVLGAVLGSLVPLPAVHAVPGEPEAVVKTASCSGRMVMWLSLQPLGKALSCRAPESSSTYFTVRRLSMCGFTLASSEAGPLIRIFTRSFPICLIIPSRSSFTSPM